MSAIQALVMGIVQGLTEFVPVSSSAHLVLVPWLLAWPAPDPTFALGFDTVLHLGTLGALLAVFWRDLGQLASAWLASLRRAPAVQAVGEGLPSGTDASGAAHATLAWALIVGTIPAVLVGVAVDDWIEGLFNSPGWVAALLIATGLLLLASERWGRSERSLGSVGARLGLVIGLAQAVAIAPGISRSGATISAGRFVGLPRAEAARFSFLLATPAVAGAGILQVARLAGAGLLAQNAGLLLLGFLSALVSGYLIIRFLLSYLQRHSLRPFAAYCLLAGGLCLAAWLLR